MRLKRQWIPALVWLKSYKGEYFSADLLAAIIVVIMLIPQSLAYAMLAGLPAQMGLYAGITPLVVYALLGSSRVLSVGPVAIMSLMTAAALGNLGLGSEQYIVAAMTLALMSGALLILLGFLKLGFVANFMSNPVVTGFITASALIIALSQLQHLLGISSDGYTVIDLLRSLWQSLDELDVVTVALSAPTLVWLFWSRNGIANILKKIGVSHSTAVLMGRFCPIFAVVLTTLITWGFSLDQRGIAIVGVVPSGLPEFTVPSFSLETWRVLAGSAILIATIGFVESISLAQGLATKRRERIDPDQELIGLGAANVATSFFGGFPVAGGFSRSVVNYEAGAATPAAGLIAAILMILATLAFVPLLEYLPRATLAATIIAAVWSLVDVQILKSAWRYSKADFLAVFFTIILTLTAGVEIGVASGVLVSLIVHLYKTSRPHVAVVGELPGTEHFRSVTRHSVQTHETILSIRIDESLYFANTRYLEDLIYGLVAEKPKLKHVILMCTAVNEIDMSALESLLAMNKRLDELGIKVHLSEVKGQVMDRLERTDFLSKLTGNVYLSQHQAVEALI